MKLTLVLLVLGIAGYALTSSSTEKSGGSIRDEFAVSIRDNTPALSVVDSDATMPLSTNTK